MVEDMQEELRYELREELRYELREELLDEIEEGNKVVLSMSILCAVLVVCLTIIDVVQSSNCGGM